MSGPSDAARTAPVRLTASRAVRGPLRELVISFGRRGYVALYRVSSRRDRIEILAIRHQREAGYHS